MIALSTRNLYLLCGPSGSGKSTVVEILTSYGYTKAKTCTTRAPRLYEPLDSYYFLSEEEFSRRKDMLTVAQYSGAYYGVYPEELGHCDIFIVEPKGVAQLKEQFTTRPIKVIGLTASEFSLYSRLRPRGPRGIERFRRDKVDFNGFETLCNIVIQNENLDCAVDTLCTYIRETEHSSYTE